MTAHDLLPPELLPGVDSGHIVFFDQNQFRSLLIRERKRSERTQSPFLTVLIDFSEILNGTDHRGEVRNRIMRVLNNAIREVDICGWNRNDCEAGLIFIDITPESRKVIQQKIEQGIESIVGSDNIDHVKVTYAIFPYPHDTDALQAVPVPVLYPELELSRSEHSLARNLKRVGDVMLSVWALIILAPVFTIIIALIKASSPGPAFFTQVRVGLGLRPFRIYKFRTMRPDSNATIHKDFIAAYIKGEIKDENDNGVYKLTDDPRITGIGKVLRKTSLDELPQLFNVLLGHMSLVGPRPPIPYEVELYDTWHIRRLIEAKPGITGLWQVEGRSRSTFDGMVRMDLRYSRGWSFWRDLLLLMRTPSAVLWGKGAY